MSCTNVLLSLNVPREVLELKFYLKFLISIIFTTGWVKGAIFAKTSTTILAGLKLIILKSCQYQSVS